MSYTLERLSEAMVSDDLKMRENLGGDLDYMIALGCAGSKDRDASALLHVDLGGSRVSYKQLRRAAINITHRLDVRRNWKLSRQQLVDIASGAVKMYLMPNCTKCTGLKYQKVKGTPHLSDRVCPRCKGTGMQAYPVQHKTHIQDVVIVLTSIRQAIEASVKARMRN